MVAHTTAIDALDSIGIEKIADLVAEAEYYGNIAKFAGVSRGALIIWLERNHSDIYARAREARADKLAEDILTISDDGLNDTMVDENGKTIVNQDVIQRSRLRVDSRKWLASKMLPKKYGDKVEIGGDQLNPIQIAVTHGMDKDASTLLSDIRGIENK